jgi:hypothetical protein
MKNKREENKMKKIVTILAVAMVAGVSMADVMLTQDFSAINVVVDDLAYSNERGIGVWLGGNATRIYTNTTEQLVINSGDNGSGRGAGIMLDSTILTDGAGTYNLSLDVVNLWNNAALEVSVWEGFESVGNPYFFDLVGTVAAGVGGVSTATVNQLATQTYLNGVVEGTTVNMDFTYDGSSDIVLLFGMTGLTGTKQAGVIDNVVVSSVIPEPATLGMIAFAGGALLVIRRKFTI